MKKHRIFYIIIPFIFTFCSLSEDKSNGLLWKISGNGLEKPSYLFGTWHGDTELRNQSFLDSVPFFYEALNSVDVYIGENVIIKEEGTVQPKFNELNILLPADSLYKDLLSEKDIIKLDSFLIQHLKTTSSRMNLKPSVLSLVLSEMYIEKKVKDLESSDNLGDSLFYKKRNQIYAETDIMDLYLQKYSKAHSKELIGLDELIEFDGNMIYHSEKSLKEDADSLMSFIFKMDTVDYVEEMNSIGLNMRQAYRNQDVYKFYNEKQKQLQDIAKSSKNVSESLDKLMKNILVDRNYKWMEKIPTLIKENSSFIAVGAGHLGGDDGLIKLLREEGYKVEPVR